MNPNLNLALALTEAWACRKADPARMDANRKTPLELVGAEDSRMRGLLEGLPDSIEVAPTHP